MMNRPLNDLWQDLAADVLVDKPVSLRPFRSRTRRKKLTWAACCALLLLIAGSWGGWVFLQSGPSTPNDSRTAQEKPKPAATGSLEKPLATESLTTGKKVEFGVLSDQELEEKLGLLNMALVGSGEDQRVIFLGSKLAGN